MLQPILSALCRGLAAVFGKPVVVFEHGTGGHRQDGDPGVGVERPVQAFDKFRERFDAEDAGAFFRGDQSEEAFGGAAIDDHVARLHGCLGDLVVVPVGGVEYFIGHHEEDIEGHGGRKDEGAGGAVKADLPPAIVQSLYDAFTEATADPGLQPLLDRFNQVPWRQNPAQYKAFAENYFNSVKPLLVKSGLAKG